MKEYIERGDVMQAFTDHVWNSNHSDLVPAPQWNHAVEIVRDIPAADVAEVRHGKWDDNAVAFYRKCTVCGCCVEWDKKPFLFGVGEYNYCPNCGAKMDGGEA